MSESLDANTQVPLEANPSSQPQPNQTPPTTRKRRRRRSHSPRAAEASRKNGARSNGPATPEGRARSNRANLIHGAYSHQDLILPEDRERYEAIYNDFVEKLHPTNHLELELLEQMVSASWRRRRISAILQQYWNEAVVAAAIEPANEQLPAVALTTKAHARMVATRIPLLALEVSEAREQRKFQSALRQYRAEETHRQKFQLKIDPGSA